MKVLLTSAAARDLNQIWDYLAEENVETANRVLKRIEVALRTLAKRPGIGHLREDLTDRRYRFLLVYSYLIVYDPETKPLQIIRVLHASRDVQMILGFPEAEQ